MVVRDPAAAEQRAELLRAEEVALDLVLEVVLPVEADRARNVGLPVQGRVLVDLDDPDRVVVQVLLEPLRLDQYVLRVVSHRRASSDFRSTFIYFRFSLSWAGRCRHRAHAGRRRRRRPSTPRARPGSASSSAYGMRESSQRSRTSAAPAPGRPDRPSRRPRRRPPRTVVSTHPGEQHLEAACRAARQAAPATRPPSRAARTRRVTWSSEPRERRDRSGSPTTASAPAPRSPPAPLGSRVVPRTAWPRAISSRASDAPPAATADDQAAGHDPAMPTPSGPPGQPSRRCSRSSPSTRASTSSALTSASPRARLRSLCARQHLIEVLCLERLASLGQLARRLQAELLESGPGVVAPEQPEHEHQNGEATDHNDGKRVHRTEV